MQWNQPISSVSRYNSETRLYTADQIRAIEAQVMQPVAAGGMGIEGYTLMQRAGQSAFDSLLQRWPSTKAISVVCGKGNNAGDGYVVARLARQLGLSVQVVAVVNPKELVGDAKRAYAEFAAAGGAVVAASAPIQHDVIVDGLLGTGYRPPLRDLYVPIIRRINQTSAAVLALDVPSGVVADNGAVQMVDGEPLAVHAALTVSFVGRKIGTYTGPGVAFVGDRKVFDLGVSGKVMSPNAASLLNWRPERIHRLSPTAYKHRRGKVLLIGGDVGMGGAVIMAAEATLRCGAGLVKVIARPEHQTALLARLPEAMFVAPELQTLKSALDAADFVVIGPGLGRNGWGEELFRQALEAKTPMLMDADALYWLKRLNQQPASRSLFITPHSGEAAHLLGLATDHLENDRINHARALAQQFNCRVVLKGPGSIVVDGSQVQVCAHGGPAMASAGMGDVLSGICAGILAPAFASGQAPAVQFAQAVALHSACADVAAATLGPRSVLATDVIRHIPNLLAQADG